MDQEQFIVANSLNQFRWVCTAARDAGKWRARSTEEEATMTAKILVHLKPSPLNNRKEIAENKQQSGAEKN